MTKTEKQLKEEIEKEFKPKVLNVLELKKENVILTDTYSFRDFKLAIKKSLLAQKQEDKKKFKEMIEKLGSGFNSNLDEKMNFEGIPLQYKVFLQQIVSQIKTELLAKIEGIK